MKCQTFTIPALHPSLNVWTRLHYIPRNNLKKEWDVMTKDAFRRAKIKKIDGPVKIKITYFHPQLGTKKRLDIDNYTPKFINDPLVGEIIEDDSVHIVQELSWNFKKGEKKSVVKICPVT